MIALNRKDPDFADLLYCRRMGEFSAFSDMAFEKHLKNLERLKNIFLNSKSKHPNMKILNPGFGLWYGKQFSEYGGSGNGRIQQKRNNG